MRALVVGLGSMGKRRIRCLQALGVGDIVAYDPREDRRDEAAREYAVRTLADFGQADWSAIDVILISTPPDRHEVYLREALRRARPAFVEASVVLGQLPQLQAEAADRGLLLAPSCTLRFHPAVQDIKRTVRDGSLGRPTNYSYHSGQYLPDWHPWERVQDYYVSKPETGGCREIVPFELTWLVDVFGWPSEARGLLGRTMDVGAAIDDTYAVALKHDGCFGVLLVDVVARQAVRNLVVNLERGQLVWNWESQAVRIYDAHLKSSRTLEHRPARAHPAYNKNIGEDMYIDETAAFLAAARGEASFPNTLRDDIRVLELLARIEESARARV